LLFLVRSAVASMTACLLAVPDVDGVRFPGRLVAACSGMPRWFLAGPAVWAVPACRAAFLLHW
jgi:hypothetical protein